MVAVTSLESQVRRLLAEGKKLQAVKLYKDSTGASLLDAKNAVETVERGGSLPQIPMMAAGSTADEGLVAEALALLQQGQKLQAVKLYKERSGVSLADAKAAVDALQAGRNLPLPGAVDERLVAELLPSLRMGDKREAIALYRKRTGAGHRDAKRRVNALARQHGLYDRESAFLSTAALLLMLGFVLLLVVGGLILFLG